MASMAHEQQSSHSASAATDVSKKAMVTQGGIAALPQQLHDERVVQASALLGIDQVRANRLVSVGFCQPSGDLVNTLQCDRTCGITAAAWRSFSRADGLRIALKGIWYGFDGLPQLLERAPRDRLRRFKLLDGFSLPPAGQTVVNAITASENTKQLREVVIGAYVSSSAADTLITQLPHLDTLRLDMMTAPNIWSPAGSTTLRDLSVVFHHNKEDEFGMQHVDMQGVARSSGLQALNLYRAHVFNFAAVSSLVDLRELHLLDGIWDDEDEPSMAPLAALTQLHTLRGDFDVDEEDWEMLAGLEQLRTLRVSSLELGAASPASSSLVELTVREEVLPGAGLQLAGDEPEDEDTEEAAEVDARQTGLLARVAPALERLVAAGALRRRRGLPTLLAGHSKLRVVRLTDAMYEASSSPSWRAGTLSSLPCLEEVEVYGGTELSVDEVLKDAAGCSKLRSLKVDCREREPGYVLSREGVAALAQGACKEALQCLTLEGVGCPALPFSVLPLLLQLPAVQEARLVLQAPERQPDPEEQEKLEKHRQRRQQREERWHQMGLTGGTGQGQGDGQRAYCLPWSTGELGEQLVAVLQAAGATAVLEKEAATKEAAAAALTTGSAAPAGAALAGGGADGADASGGRDGGSSSDSSDDEESDDDDVIMGPYTKSSKVCLRVAARLKLVCEVREQVPDLPDYVYGEELGEGAEEEMDAWDDMYTYPGSGW